MVGYFSRMLGALRSILGQRLQFVNSMFHPVCWYVWRPETLVTNIDVMSYFFTFVVVKVHVLMRERWEEYDFPECEISGSSVCGTVFL